MRTHPKPIHYALKDMAKQFADAFERGMGEHLTTGLTQTCLNCTNFDEPSEVCKKYNARPPARVIAYGCDHYDNPNDIPF